jgi:FkbM family methyltransferase
MQGIRTWLVYACWKAGIWGTLDSVRDYAVFIAAGKSKTFSQFGEDLFLQEYFAGRQGIYIDIGGNHPLKLSNTYLLYKMGWSGIVVEPIRRMCAKHKRFRPRDTQINAAAGQVAGELNFYEMIPHFLSTCEPQEAKARLSSESTKLIGEYSVPVLTVAELYSKYLAPRPVLLLSVDTEGHDIYVLRGIDWKSFRPEVIICEGNDEASKAIIVSFLAEKGYRAIRDFGCNTIFSTYGPRIE